MPHFFCRPGDSPVGCEEFAYSMVRGANKRGLMQPLVRGDGIVHCGSHNERGLRRVEGLLVSRGREGRIPLVSARVARRFSRLMLAFRIPCRTSTVPPSDRNLSDVTLSVPFPYLCISDRCWMAYKISFPGNSPDGFFLFRLSGPPDTIYYTAAVPSVSREKGD